MCIYLLPQDLEEKPEEVENLFESQEVPVEARIEAF